MKATELDRLYWSVNNWKRWGEADERGTLNYITPGTVTSAASQVTEGHVVGCGYIDVSKAMPTGTPGHGMVRTGETLTSGGSFASDYFGLAFHGPGSTHIDALSHGIHNGVMYNGSKAELVTHEGAQVNAVTTMKNGILTRGLLLDLPRLRGEEYISPDEPIYSSELEAALQAQDEKIAYGDAVVLYVGREARLRALGPQAEGPEGLGPLAGLHVSCLSWLHENHVSILGSDGGNDVLPSGIDHMALPLHIGALVHMGMPLIDNLSLKELASACAVRRRWAFLYSLAPLMIRGGTGSPVNPLAVF